MFRLSRNFRLKDPSRDLWYQDVLNSKKLYQTNSTSTKLANLQSQKKAWRPALVSQLDLFLDPDQIIRFKRQA